MKYYHVTLFSNIESILKEGLIPQIGQRSIDANETEKLVYLFQDLIDVENALMNWLGDWYTDAYGENIPIAILEIILPIDFPIEEGIVEYEKISKQKIPPKFIRFLRKE